MNSVDLKRKLSSPQTLMYLLMIMFLAGELIGTLIYLYRSILIENFVWVESITDKFFNNRMGCTYIQTVVNSFSGTFTFLLACMILGFGAVFQPIEIFIPFLHGMGIGIVLAEMNGSYGFNGFWTSAFMILPYSAISAVIVIISAREAVLMSSCICRGILTKSGKCTADINLYLTKFLILFAAAAITALADSLMTYLFAGLWVKILEM